MSAAQTICDMLADPESDDQEIAARIWCFDKGYIINEDKLNVYGNYIHSFQYSRENGKYINWCGYPELYRSYNRYTTSIDAAMSIGHEELEGWTWVASTNDKGCHFNFYSPNPDHMRSLSRVMQSDFLSTIPRAICHAKTQALDYVRGLI